MTILLIETDGCKEVKDFFKSVHKRLQSKDLLKNAFKGQAKQIDKCCFALEMRPWYIFFNLPRWAFKLFIRKGLKHNGYSGKIRFLKDQEALGRLLSWDK